MRLVRNTRLLRIGLLSIRIRSLPQRRLTRSPMRWNRLSPRRASRPRTARLTWLEAQAVLQREGLEKDDEALMQFDKENQIDALEREKKQIEESLKGFNDVLTQIESQQTLANDLCSNLATLEGKSGEAGKSAGSHAARQGDRIPGRAIGSGGFQTRRASDEVHPRHPEVAAQEEVIKISRATGKGTARVQSGLLKQQAESLRRNIQKQSGQAAELEQKIVERTTSEDGLGTCARSVRCELQRRIKPA